MPTRSETGPVGRPGPIATFFPPVALTVAVFFAFGWLPAAIVLVVGASLSWWFVQYAAPRWIDGRRGASPGERIQP